MATEREVGPGDEHGGFEIEHFKPQGLARFARFRCYYPNLLWACAECNGVKGDVWPVAEEVALGMYFADPCAEPLAKHLEVAGDVVRALTQVGEYMLDEIALNSEVHKYRRKRRATILTSIARLEATAESYREIGFEGAVNKVELEANLLKLETEIAELKAQIEPSAPPWDAISACACAPAASKKDRKRTRRKRRELRLAEAGKKRP